MTLELPTIHAHDSEYRAIRKDSAIEWSLPRLPDPMGKYGHHAYPCCNWCGSVAPTVLLDLIHEGKELKLQSADWKYGWPHKFYIDKLLLPQEILDLKLEKVISSRHYTDDDGTAHDEIISTAPYTYDYGKFYNEHFKDLADQPELFNELGDLVEEHTGIRFLWTEGKLMFRSGYSGR